ncbi:MAG: hypothetical protein AAGF44_00910 [Pseudomonadota bacterium]
MLLFRFLCAILLAWGINVALSRPEASALITEAPELLVLAPIAAAAVGFVNLAKRQGWGVIVAIANGIWAGVLTLFLALLLFMFLIEIGGNFRTIGDYGDFARLFGSAAEPLIVLVFDVPLLTVIVIAAAAVGILTEILHWCLVRLLRGRMGPES